MAIITISRGSYSMGAHVAEQVARRLDYDIISRDILLDASDRFNIPELKLTQAIHDAPGMFARYGHAKQSYIAYIRAALTKRVAGDNVVYHGLAGHLLLQTIPHVLKVRINADLEARVKIEMSRLTLRRPATFLSKMISSAGNGQRTCTGRIPGTAPCMTSLSASTSWPWRTRWTSSAGPRKPAHLPLMKKAFSRPETCPSPVTSRR